MIWLNAWALLGLAGVALPVLIHLLSRGRARTRRFPSLRFIEPSQLLPTHRTRLHDPLLLALRCTIVALAALALAQPLLMTAGRKRAVERGLARAIVLDTSASMHRRTPGALSALDSARRIARTLADEAQASVVVETNDPARALAAAVAWLTTHRQRGEVAVVSDFQRSQLDSSDVRAVPATVSVALHRVPVMSEGSLETRWTAGDRRVTVRAAPHGDSTNAQWAVDKETVAGIGVTLLGAESDRAAIAVTQLAAATTPVPLPADTARAVAIVFPGYADRRSLESAVQPAYVPWMVDLLRRLSVRGNDVQRSGVAVIGGRRQLLLFTDSAPGSLASARLAAEANRALSVAPPLKELEPETLSDREIESLQRQAREAPPSRTADPNGESDARWLWATAVLLLLVEIPLRRSASRSVAAAAEERARAA